MGQDTIVSFSDPAFRDELSDLVRQGAQRIIRQAVEAELKAFLEAHERDRDERGRRAVVRNGYQPEREVLTDRKSTRLNSSHVKISYAVFGLKKKNDNNHLQTVIEGELDVSLYYLHAVRFDEG